MEGVREREREREGGGIIVLLLFSGWFWVVAKFSKGHCSSVRTSK